MRKTISAVFDSTDMADIARMRLREQGVDIGGYSVRTIEAARQELEMGMVINPYEVSFSNSVDESWSSMNGSYMQRHGGFLYSLAGSSNEHSMGNGSSRLQDVRMILSVDDTQMKLAESVITSCHGTKIRQV